MGIVRAWGHMIKFVRRKKTKKGMKSVTLRVICQTTRQGGLIATFTAIKCIRYSVFQAQFLDVEKLTNNYLFQTTQK